MWIDLQQLWRGKLNIQLKSVKTVTVTMVRKFNGVRVNKESKYFSLRVLYYATVTALSCENYPLPSILLAT